MEKWSFLDQNHGFNTFGKMSIFRLFSNCFFDSLERRFLSLEYHKRQFPGLYCLKKKVEKMAIFGLKPWVNPFGKMSIFRLFSTFCYYSLERRFFVLEYYKRRIPGVYCLIKRKWKNGHFWTKPCKKKKKNVNFSTFFNFLLL